MGKWCEQVTRGGKERREREEKKKRHGYDIAREERKKGERKNGASWSCVKIHKSSAAEPTQVNRRKAAVSRIAREFSQAVRQPAKNCHTLVPGMAQYEDSQEIFTDSEVEHVGNEDFSTADEVPATTSQRTEFFELSPK